MYSFIYLFIYFSLRGVISWAQAVTFAAFPGISPTNLLYRASLLGPKAEPSTLLKSCLMNSNKEVISSCFYWCMRLAWRLFVECWLMLNLTSRWHRVIRAESQHQRPFHYLLRWQSKTFWTFASNKNIKWKSLPLLAFIKLSFYYFKFKNSTSSLITV